MYGIVSSFDELVQGIAGQEAGAPHAFGKPMQIREHWLELLEELGSLPAP